MAKTKSTPIRSLGAPLRRRGGLAKEGPTTATSTSTPTSTTIATAATSTSTPTVATFGNKCKGLLSLPVELFTMVLSEFRTITLEEVLEHPPSLPKECNERNDALHALSRTCRSLRESCLPLAWEHVEATVSTQGNGFYKQVSEKLEKRSKGLVRNPQLAQYVKIMTVTLTRCNTGTVLPAFADCLEILPNIHTIQVVHAHSQMTTALKDAFNGRAFPQIRTIVLPDFAHNLLRACPEVRHVTCSEGDGSKLVTAIGAACKNVEMVTDIRPSMSIMKRLAKAAPQLHSVEIRHMRSLGHFLDESHLTTYKDGWHISHISLLKNLTTISVSLVTRPGDAAVPESVVREFENKATKVLKENKAKGEKRILFAHYEDRRDYGGKEPVYSNPPTTPPDLWLMSKNTVFVE